MEGSKVKPGKDAAGKTVRFRVASANSGRVLTEVFKDDAASPQFGGGSTTTSASDSPDSDCGSNPEAEGGRGRHGRAPASEANSHLHGLTGRDPPDESGSEPDDLLLYASAKRRPLFTHRRINICSRNGTVRGVRNKVSAGQVLFNHLSNAGNPRGNRFPQKKKPWEKD